MPKAKTKSTRETENLEAIIETLLFVSERPATLKELAETVGQPIIEVTRAIDNLTDRLGDRGVRVIREGEKFHMASAPEYSKYAARLLNKELRNDLTETAVEILAIVTYKQPVTRAEIEEIRGVSSESILRQLLLRGLVEPKGRRDTIGRPIEYVTTMELLNHLGVTDASTLPELANIKSDDTQLDLKVVSQESPNAEVSNELEA